MIAGRNAEKSRPALQAFEAGAYRGGLLRPLGNESWATRSLEWRPPKPNSLHRELLDGLEPRNPVKQGFQLSDVGNDTAVQAWQDDSRVYPGPFRDWYVRELARFDVYPNQVGIVRGCNTWAELFEALPEPVGCGTPYDLFSQMRSGSVVVWGLRLVQNTQEMQGAPYIYSTWADLPGYNYAALPWWIDNRFTFSVPDSQNVFWIVPANFSLRLYALFLVGGGNVSGVSGRLWGYTQPSRLKAAGINVRHGWQS